MTTDEALKVLRGVKLAADLDRTSPKHAPNLKSFYLFSETAHEGGGPTPMLSAISDCDEGADWLRELFLAIEILSQSEGEVCPR